MIRLRTATIEQSFTKRLTFIYNQFRNIIIQSIFNIYFSKFKFQQKKNFLAYEAVLGNRSFTENFTYLILCFS